MADIALHTCVAGSWGLGFLLLAVAVVLVLGAAAPIKSTVR